MEGESSMNARLIFAATAAALLLGAPGSNASAETYPSRPIRILLPFAAGSVSDVTHRVFADKIGPLLGTSIVIENQPRAGGTTAAVAAKTAQPDGYTLVTLSSSTAISVSLLKSLPYDPVKDFLPISGLSTFANIIAVNASSKYRTLDDLLAAARAKPGTLNVGTTTVGATNNLAAHLLKSMTKINFVVVPFRTPGELLTAVLRGDVDAIIQSYGALKSALLSNQIRGLASTTPTRAAYAPDVPTVDETGVKGFDVVTWNGLFAPAGTPPAIIETLNKATRAALSDADLKKRFIELGLEPQPSTPAELKSRMHDEIGKWAQVIHDAGIDKQ
jgi:tripartite-type tricarboxylate transporter receptor subunit TctC